MLPRHATLSVPWCHAASSPPACHVTRLRVETGPVVPACLLFGDSTPSAHVPAPLSSELTPKAKASLSKHLDLGGVPPPPGHATHLDRARLCPKPCIGLPGCMQSFGFPILAYQGQGAETQGQFLDRRCHTVFCLIEGVDTHELGFSTSICRWLTQWKWWHSYKPLGNQKDKVTFREPGKLPEELTSVSPSGSHAFFSKTIELL